MNLRDERGSLPMALLVIIVMAGLLSVLTATVVSGQRQTRHDENYEQALQVAETGLDRATVLVQQRQQADDFCIESTAPTTVATTCATDPAPGEWVVVADKNALGDWVVSSTGNDNGRLRTVEHDVNVDSLFNVAAFGKFFVDFNGGNGADSYRAGTWDFSGATPTYTWTDASATTGLICDDDPGGSAVTDPTANNQSNAYICSPRATGNGVVATNGALKLKGQVAADSDAFEVHFAQSPYVPDPLPGATGYCEGVPETCNTPPDYFRDPIELPEPQPPCPPTATSFPNAGTPTDGNGNYVLAPGVHCFANVTLDGDGAGGDPDIIVQGDPENPTRIYLTGTLSVENSALVNFKRRADGNYDPIPRPPASLLIFSTGTGPTLTFGNHASVSAAIYAPSAAFGGGAQGNIYGSLIAGSINNNGGWNFHYDESLSDVTLHAPLVGENWREE